ncbi:MAG: single-stranded-DNA-specific exonuclease [Gammaproteobacteria bacterium]|jgi:single-stranded-DNA-specific exonuclease
MTRSIERRASAADASILSDALHPVLDRMYRNRGLRSSQELDTSLKSLAPASTLLGIDGAVELLVQALQAQQRVLIVGDFDADGATATTLAVLGLRAMGFAQVDFLVPNRFEFGYGLTPEIVAVAAAQSPDLLITVDNGISSIDGVAAAREAGIAVLVTDHHLPAEQLPDANAIINPNQGGCSFPSKHLAGVGVMFYVLAALRSRLVADGHFERSAQPVPNVAQWLDLVALGTVADVVALDQNNRILVEQGIRRIRAGQCRPGISALLRAGRRDPQRCVASDLGFAAGPRLNAAGRLSDMRAGIECLLNDDEGECSRMAAQLDALNRARRDIEADMQREALASMQGVLDGIVDLPYGVCLFQEHWHQGVVGIVASRVRERVHRPVIAFAREGEGTLKGSARSIPGLHIRDALDAVAAANPGLLLKFGGHAMAAGLSLNDQDLQTFSSAFNTQLQRLLQPGDLDDVLRTDGPLEEVELNLELARTLRAGGPWGQAFPEPLFDGEFDVLSRRIVGEKHLKMSLSAATDSAAIDAIAFNITDEDWPAGARRIHAAYRLDVNDYQSRESVQLVIEWLEVVSQA